MAISLIRNFIAKQMMKKGKGITSVIPDAKEVTFSADHLEKRLINMGVDLKSIKSEGQLQQILAYVKQAEDQAFAKRFKDVLKPFSAFCTYYAILKLADKALTGVLLIISLKFEKLLSANKFAILVVILSVLVLKSISVKLI